MPTSSILSTDSSSLAHESLSAPKAEEANRPGMVSEPKVMRTTRHRRNHSTDSLSMKSLSSHRRSNSINIVTHPLNHSTPSQMSPLLEQQQQGLNMPMSIPAQTTQPVSLLEDAVETKVDAKKDKKIPQWVDGGRPSHRRGYSITDFRTLPGSSGSNLIPFFERHPSPAHPPRSQSSMSHRRGTSMSHLYMCSTPPHPTAGLMMTGDMFQRRAGMDFHPSLSLDMNSFGADLNMDTLSSAHTSPTSPYVGNPLISPRNPQASPMSPAFPFPPTESPAPSMAMALNDPLHIASPVAQTYQQANYQDGIVQDLVNMRIQRNASVDYDAMMNRMNGTLSPLFQTPQDALAMELSGMGMPMPMRVPLGMPMEMMDQGYQDAVELPPGMDQRLTAMDATRLDLSSSPWSSCGEKSALEAEDMDDRLRASTRRRSSRDSNDDLVESVCAWGDCGLVFASVKELVDHVTDFHIGNKKTSYFCEWKGCTREKKPFSKRHKLCQHLRTHTGERPYVCHVNNCGKRFARQDGLNTHAKTHLDVKPFECDYPGCDKAYYHARSLRKHLRIHQEGGVAVADVEDEDVGDEEEEQVDKPEKFEAPKKTMSPDFSQPKTLPNAPLWGPTPPLTPSQLHQQPDQQQHQWIMSPNGQKSGFLYNGAGGTTSTLNDTQHHQSQHMMASTSFSPSMFAFEGSSWTPNHHPWGLSDLKNEGGLEGVPVYATTLE